MDAREEDEVWVESYNPVSKRHAILEDDGLTAWLYLHGPTDDRRHTAAVEKSCFAYNRKSPIKVEEIPNYKHGPPPIASGYAAECAVCETPKSHEWLITWATNGEAVLLSRDGEPWCLIQVGGKEHGFSRSIKTDGPWGRPWDQRVFSQLKWASAEP